MYTRHMVVSQDLPHLLEIERSSKETFWDKDDFKELVKIENNIVGKVVEVDEAIVGYMVFQLDMEQIDLLNLTIKTEYRRTGYASNLIDHLKSKLNSVRKTIRAEVRESNLQGQLFLKKNGFICTDILPFWFEDYVNDKEPPRLESAYLFYYDRK